MELLLLPLSRRGLRIPSQSRVRLRNGVWRGPGLIGIPIVFGRGGCLPQVFADQGVNLRRLLYGLVRSSSARRSPSGQHSSVLHGSRQGGSRLRAPLLLLRRQGVPL